MAFSIELTEDDISEDLRKLAENSEDVLEDALEAAATAMAALGQRAFDEPGLRPAPWPALSADYGESRKKKVKAKNKNAKVQLLIDSGTLYQGVQAQGAVFGATAPYAAAHQFGYDDHGLPARPYLPITEDGESLTDEANQEVIEIIEESFEGITD